MNAEKLGIIIGLGTAFFIDWGLGAAWGSTSILTWTFGLITGFLVYIGIIIVWGDR